LPGNYGPRPDAFGGSPDKSKSLLEEKIQHFQLKNVSLLDALAELSSRSIAELHLGIEEVARERLSDPRDKSVSFSLDLKDKTFREILDALCSSDARYAWSLDGSSINVYPRAVTMRRQTC